MFELEKYMAKMGKIVIVSEIHRGEATVSIDGKKTRIKIPRTFLKKKQKERNYLTVGDKIEIEFDKKAKRYILLKRFERKNLISRKDPFLNHISHVLAANIDYLVVFMSLSEPDIDWEMVDRYLITADANNIEAVLVLNKIDLLTKDEIDKLPIKLYKNIDVKTILTSVKNGLNIDQLKDIIKDKIVLFSGPSGVGKSSLINSLNPKNKQKVGDISFKNQRGKHTTRYSKLIEVDGTYIIDSPGVQGFGLDIDNVDDIKKHYREFYPYLEKCKYPNCTHTHEKICGVKEGLERGDIDNLRYQNYINISKYPNMKFD